MDRRYRDPNELAPEVLATIPRWSGAYDVISLRSFEGWPFVDLRGFAPGPSGAVDVDRRRAFTVSVRDLPAVIAALEAAHARALALNLVTEPLPPRGAPAPTAKARKPRAAKGAPRARKGAAK